MLLYSRNHYTQQENPSVKSTQMIESIILQNTNIMPPLYNIPGADPASEERGGVRVGDMPNIGIMIIKIYNMKFYL